MGQERTATMRTRLELGAERPGLRLGFTLIELLVVITIIGIILAFLLIAAHGRPTVARRKRATQALITKLEGGLNDRLDALLQNRPNPNYAHGYIAGVYPGTGTEADNGPLMLPAAIQTTGSGIGSPNPKCNTLQRAQVIATFDYIKGELPGRLLSRPGVPEQSRRLQRGVSPQLHGIAVPRSAVRHPQSVPPPRNYILPLGNMVIGPRNSRGLDFRLWRCPRRPQTLTSSRPIPSWEHRQRY